MEIGAPYTRGRAAEILCIMYKKPTTFVSRSQKWWGIIILNYCGCSGSHPLNPSHFNLQASPRGLEKTAAPSIIGG